MKVLFAGTPDFAAPALAALIAEHEIVGVYTQPDRKSGRGKKITMSPIKQLALEHNLAIHQPSSLHGQEEIIEQLQPDVFVVVAFGMLLPQSILEIPAHGCVNIHGSILPRWRGAAPIQRAIEAGDSETGVSIMQMDAGLDTGPVFQILKTEISDQATSQTLHDELAELGARGVSETLATIEKQLQSNQPKISYAKKISKNEGQIDWQESAETIQRKIRAFNPWPICQTHHAQTRIRLWRSTVVNISPKSPLAAGQVIDLDDNGLTIACGTSKTIQTTGLRLEILQRDGSKALASKEFLNGYPVNVGDILS
ncbi:UNVERIFIED_CONTAM: hypothetical protein GTU68_003425 [Idotea baltica]|nr:hypothetical protein [Idotea baltica]